MLEIRRKAREMYMALETFCVPSRELDIALAKLEESLMWANKGVSKQHGLVIYDEEQES